LYQQNASYKKSQDAGRTTCTQINEGDWVIDFFILETLWNLYFPRVVQIINKEKMRYGKKMLCNPLLLNGNNFGALLAHKMLLHVSSASGEQHRTTGFGIYTEQLFQFNWINRVKGLSSVQNSASVPSSSLCNLGLGIRCYCITALHHILGQLHIPNWWKSPMFNSLSAKGLGVIA
jgi:hypothetical protein